MALDYDVDYDVDDDGPMMVEPDESRHYRNERLPDPPPDRRRPGRYGPTGRDQFREYADEDEFGELSQRHFNTGALPGILILGAGAGALIWVFAGGVVLCAVGGVGVLAWAGKKFVGWRRRRGGNGEGRSRGAERRAARRDARRNNRANRRGLGDRLGLGGGRAAARRAGLLQGMGAGGLGGRGGKRGGGRPGGGPGGGGGGGGRKPKLGPSGPKGGGSKGPKSSGGLLGRLGRGGKGPTAGSRSGGLPGAKPGAKPGVKPKGRGPGRHTAAAKGASLGARMLPGAKGRQARIAHKQQKMKAQKTAQQARQAKQTRRDFGVKMRQARFDRRQKRRENRAARRTYRAQNPGFFRRQGRDFGRGLGSIFRYGVALPAVLAARYGVGVPVMFTYRRILAPIGRVTYRRVLTPVGRFVWIRPSTAIAAWAGRRYRGQLRAMRRRHLLRVMYIDPAIRGWIGGRWSAFTSWVMSPWWMSKLRDMARSRGLWVAGLGVLALMLAGLIYAGRKAREWAWDGKKARSVFDTREDTQQNTDQSGQPDAQQQPNAEETRGPSGVPDPDPQPRGNPWDYDTDQQQAQPAPGWTPPNTQGAPQMAHLLANPTTGMNDRLEIPAGLHPVFAALAQDAQVLEGMFKPRSFPDLAIFLNSLGTKMRYERDKWSRIGDQLVSRFPGFNLAQEFAADVHEAYTDLARRADDIFQGYRDLEEATFARFLDPRENEIWADTQAWSGMDQIDPIRLTDNTMMHGSHTIWLTSVDMNLTNWFPDQQGNNDDYVIELQHFLHSLHPFYVARARFAQNFVINGLVQHFPIEEGVADITMQIARGFADLADKGRALAVGYEARNPYDVNRRYSPKQNEHLRDVGNTEMSNAGR